MILKISLILIVCTAVSNIFVIYPMMKWKAEYKEAWIIKIDEIFSFEKKNVYI